MRKHEQIRAQQNVLDQFSQMCTHGFMSSLEKRNLFICFLHARIADGQVTVDEAADIVEVEAQPMISAGGFEGEMNDPLPTDPASQAVMGQTLHLMRMKLRELHPEFTDEMIFGDTKGRGR